MAEDKVKVEKIEKAEKKQELANTEIKAESKEGMKIIMADEKAEKKQELANIESREDKKIIKTDEKMKIFNLYSTEEVKIDDPALKRVINLNPKLILKSHGRNLRNFEKTKINVVERLINLIGVPGHRGKKHRIIKSKSSGKYERNTKIILDALKIIETRKKENPIQILVRAVENSAPKDEITVIEYGGARYPQAVDISPLRRLGLALRNIIHGASDKAFGKKITISEALASEIIAASEKNNESFAIVKKNEAEKQADSAR